MTWSIYLDPQLFSFLIRCEFPLSAFQKFAGRTKKSLRKLPIDELEILLDTCLASTPNSYIIQGKFISCLLK